MSQRSADAYLTRQVGHVISSVRTVAELAAAAAAAEVNAAQVDLETWRAYGKLVCRKWLSALILTRVKSGHEQERSP